MHVHRHTRHPCSDNASNMAYPLWLNKQANSTQCLLLISNVLISDCQCDCGSCLLGSHFELGPVFAVMAQKVYGFPGNWGVWISTIIECVLSQFQTR